MFNWDTLDEPYAVPILIAMRLKVGSGRARRLSCTSIFIGLPGARCTHGASTAKTIPPTENTSSALGNGNINGHRTHRTEFIARRARALSRMLFKATRGRFELRNSGLNFGQAYIATWSYMTRPSRPVSMGAATSVVARDEPTARAQPLTGRW